MITKLLISFAVLFGLVHGVEANVWDTLRTQVFEQTKITIHESGGPAGFYDASSGNDFSLKKGILSHVLTNRFLAASLGWYSADNQSGVLVGGPTVKVKAIFETYYPTLTEAYGAFVPPFIKPLDIGVNYGWGTDDSRHYGLHLIYDFGG